MANDPRKLKPSECCRLLNSTPLGTVINERQLHRHRVEAGNRIGDGRHVDLLAYADWLHRKTSRTETGVRRRPVCETQRECPRTQRRDRTRRPRHRGAAGGRGSRAQSQGRRLIPSSFCEAYFGLTFHLAWSPDHLKVINKIEEAVIRGGLFSLAMARGSGKSSLAEVACIWAVLNGYRDFVCLIGSDEGHACDMLDSIKTELDSNDLLAGRLSRSLLSDPSPRRNRQPRQRATLSRQANANRLDRERNRLANDRRQQSQRRDHQGRRPHRSHPRHEIQTSRRQNGSAVACRLG